MNTNTGDIFAVQDRSEIFEDNIEMKIQPTKKQLSRKPIVNGAIGRVGRNDPCPCGSGLKAKKCHLQSK
jgi:uncharacterized protein YecA (UPF0149 family)